MLTLNFEFLCRIIQKPRVKSGFYQSYPSIAFTFNPHIGAP